MFLDKLLFLIGKIVFFTGAIAGNSFPKPLSPEEEKQALSEMYNGSKEAKDKLITHNMRLVAHIVKKYSGAGETDDLISVGSIGLIKAVNTFNADKGTSLATFASRCIENEILMMLRSNKKYKNDVYLNDPIGTDKDGNELTLLDLLFEGEDSVFLEVDRAIEREKFLRFIKSVLTEREYTVLCLRYGLKGEGVLPQREVAKYLQISRSYISRIEKKGVEKLKLAIKRGQFNC